MSDNQETAQMKINDIFNHYKGLIAFYSNKSVSDRSSRFYLIEIMKSFVAMINSLTNVLSEIGEKYRTYLTKDLIDGIAENYQIVNEYSTKIRSDLFASTVNKQNENSFVEFATDFKSKYTSLFIASVADSLFASIDLDNGISAFKNYLFLNLYITPILIFKSEKFVTKYDINRYIFPEHYRIFDNILLECDIFTFEELEKNYDMYHNYWENKFTLLGRPIKFDVPNKDFSAKIHEVFVKHQNLSNEIREELRGVYEGINLNLAKTEDLINPKVSKYVKIFTEMIWDFIKIITDEKAIYNSSASNTIIKIQEFIRNILPSFKGVNYYDYPCLEYSFLWRQISENENGVYTKHFHLARYQNVNDWSLDNGIRTRFSSFFISTLIIYPLVPKEIGFIDLKSKELEITEEQIEFIKATYHLFVGIDDYFNFGTQGVYRSLVKTGLWGIYFKKLPKPSNYFLD